MPASPAQAAPVTLEREELRQRIATLNAELDTAYLEERLDKPPRIRVALALIALKETPMLLDALDHADAEREQVRADLQRAQDALREALATVGELRRTVTALMPGDAGRWPAGCPQCGCVGSVDPERM